MIKEKTVEKVKGYWEEGKTVSAIASLCGISRTSVYEVLKENNLYEKRERVSKIKERPLTRFHELLGHKISWERTFIKKAKIKDMADELGISPSRLAAMEAGICDPTISDLVKLSELVETKPYLLLKEISDQIDREKEVYTEIE